MAVPGGIVLAGGGPHHVVAHNVHGRRLPGDAHGVVARAAATGSAGSGSAGSGSTGSSSAGSAGSGSADTTGSSSADATGSSSAGSGSARSTAAGAARAAARGAAAVRRAGARRALIVLAEILIEHAARGQKQGQRGKDVKLHVSCLRESFRFRPSFGLSPANPSRRAQRLLDGTLEQAVRVFFLELLRFLGRGLVVPAQHQGLYAQALAFFRQASFGKLAGMGG